MRIARFVLLLKLNTSKETWQHYLSWQVGGEFFCRRYAPLSTWEMRHRYSVMAARWRVSLSRFLVPKSQVLGMNRVDWAPAEGRPGTSPEMWYSVLHAATVSLLFLYLLFYLHRFQLSAYLPVATLPSVHFFLSCCKFLLLHLMELADRYLFSNCVWVLVLGSQLDGRHSGCLLSSGNYHIVCAW